MKDGKIVRQLPMAVEEVPAEVSCALDLVGSYPSDLDISYTEEEIAAVLGVTVAAVKAVEESAIRQLRHYKTSAELRRLWTLMHEP